MSTYHGRPGPNVSQYIANLNMNSQPQFDLGQSRQASQQQQQQQQQDLSGLDDDLALFTNTEFFDVDLGTVSMNQPPTLAYDASQQRSLDDLKQTSANNGGYLDFLNDDYSISQDFVAFPPAPNPTSPAVTPILPQRMQHQTAPISIPTSTQISSSSAYSPISATSPTTTIGHNNKRKLSPSTSTIPKSLEEASRLAAEEDKRRRNTAASARFRVKKKLREQALEKNLKDMTVKNEELESKVKMLETENTWLKNLLLQKGNAEAEAREDSKGDGKEKDKDESRDREVITKKRRVSSGDRSVAECQGSSTSSNVKHSAEKDIKVETTAA